MVSARVEKMRNFNVFASSPTKMPAATENTTAALRFRTKNFGYRNLSITFVKIFSKDI